ncbi:hypothetical protein X975_16159, partial [Stegodyphus mimosarum]
MTATHKFVPYPWKQKASASSAAAFLYSALRFHHLAMNGGIRRMERTIRDDTERSPSQNRIAER